MADNRIDPTAPPKGEPVKPTVTGEQVAIGLLASPLARRAIGAIVGAALGASCSLWPAKVQPICVAISKAIHETFVAGPTNTDKP